MVTKTFYYNESEQFNDKIEEWLHKHIECKGFLWMRCRKNYRITIIVEEFKDEQIY